MIEFVSTIFLFITLAIYPTLAQNIHGDSAPNVRANFSTDFAYKGIVFSNISDKGNSSLYYSDLFDGAFAISFHNLLKNESTNLMVHAWGLNGRDINENVNSVQGVSHLVVPNYFNVAELYLEQTFFEKRLSILGGLYDVSSEFDTKETADLFINPTSDIETILEITYSLQLYSFFNIQPDLQYIINSGNGTKQFNYILTGIKLTINY